MDFFKLTGIENKVISRKQRIYADSMQIARGQTHSLFTDSKAPYQKIKFFLDVVRWNSPSGLKLYSVGNYYELEHLEHINLNNSHLASVSDQDFNLIFTCSVNDGNGSFVWVLQSDNPDYSILISSVVFEDSFYANEKGWLNPANPANVIAQLEPDYINSVPKSDSIDYGLFPTPKLTGELYDNQPVWCISFDQGVAPSSILKIDTDVQTILETGGIYQKLTYEKTPLNMYLSASDTAYAIINTVDIFTNVLNLQCGASCNYVRGYIRYIKNPTPTEIAGKIMSRRNMAFGATLTQQRIPVNGGHIYISANLTALNVFYEPKNLSDVKRTCLATGATYPSIVQFNVLQGVKTQIVTTLLSNSKTTITTHDTVTGKVYELEIQSICDTNATVPVIVNFIERYIGVII